MTANNTHISAHDGKNGTEIDPLKVEAAEAARRLTPPMRAWMPPIRVGSKLRNSGVKSSKSRLIAIGERVKRVAKSGAKVRVRRQTVNKEGESERWGQ